MRVALLVLVASLSLGCGGKRAAAEPGPEAVVAPGNDATTAPVSAEPSAVETRSFGALAGCTRMACPPDAPCCNQCQFGGWGEDGVTVEAATGELPRCDVDGCGQCASRLEATGSLIDGVFRATSWRMVP